MWWMVGCAPASRSPDGTSRPRAILTTVETRRSRTPRSALPNSTGCRPQRWARASCVIPRRLRLTRMFGGTGQHGGLGLRLSKLRPRGGPRTRLLSRLKEHSIPTRKTKLSASNRAWTSSSGGRGDEIGLYSCCGVCPKTSSPDGQRVSPDLYRELRRLRPVEAYASRKRLVRLAWSRTRLILRMARGPIRLFERPKARSTVAWPLATVWAMKSHDNGAGHEAEPKCGGKTRAGGTCKNAAGFKTGHPGIWSVRVPRRSYPNP